MLGHWVEILPGVVVSLATARRIQALTFSLFALVGLLAATRLPQFSPASLFASRPVLTLPAATAHDPAPRLDPTQQSYLDGFQKLRKRAHEVLQYALTTAQPELDLAHLELSTDAATRFRLRVTSRTQDPAALRAYLENLRVILPDSGLTSTPGATPEAAPVLVVDSDPMAAAGAPQRAPASMPAAMPARALAEVDAAPPAPLAAAAPSGGTIEIADADPTRDGDVDAAPTRARVTAAAPSGGTIEVADADGAPTRPLARVTLPGSETAPSGGTIDVADADPAPAASLAPAAARSVTAPSGGTIETADLAPAALPRAKPLLTLTPPPAITGAPEPLAPPPAITGATDAEPLAQPVVPVKQVARALLPAAPWRGLTDRTASTAHALKPARTARPSARAVPALPPGRTVAAARALEQLRARAAEHTHAAPPASDLNAEPSTESSSGYASHTPSPAAREAASAAFDAELDASPSTSGGDAE